MVMGKIIRWFPARQSGRGNVSREGREEREGAGKQSVLFAAFAVFARHPADLACARESKSPNSTHKVL